MLLGSMTVQTGQILFIVADLLVCFDFIFIRAPNVWNIVELLFYSFKWPVLESFPLCMYFSGEAFSTGSNFLETLLIIFLNFSKWETAAPSESIQISSCSRQIWAERSSSKRRLWWPKRYLRRRGRRWKERARWSSKSPISWSCACKYWSVRTWTRYWKCLYSNQPPWRSFETRISGRILVLWWMVACKWKD